VIADLQARAVATIDVALEDGFITERGA
jgi:hypothetical protein